MFWVSRLGGFERVECKDEKTSIAMKERGLTGCASHGKEPTLNKT
jgi:hypothetical protein